MAIFPVLGKAAGGARMERKLRSPNFRNGRFQNLVPTEVMLKGTSLFKMIKDYRNRPANTAPAKPVPSTDTDLSALPNDGNWVVWFGHSSYLLKLEGVTILVDPVFSGNAAPVSFMAKAFPRTSVYNINRMPAIDILVLTHDHYDHLDYRTVKELQPKVGKVVTSLGVGAHLEYWGVEEGSITELDWWQSWQFAGKGLTFTATPARHFSGRTFRRAGTLWSSFVLQGKGYCLFLGGDSGYGSHFREIGDRFGPFGMAFLECGQYGKNWPHIHMFPEETVEAAIDLRADAVMPVHWGKFTLSLHPWNEPVQRVVVEAGLRELPLLIPRIGQPVPVGGPYPADPWWAD